MSARLSTVSRYTISKSAQHSHTATSAAHSLRTSRRACCTKRESVCSGATWGIDRVDSRDGLDSKYNNSGATGEGALVYILDTGVRISHDDFEGRAEAGARARGFALCSTS